MTQRGRIWQQGQPLPNEMRSKIVEMAAEGYGPTEISNELKITAQCASRILKVKYTAGIQS